MTEAAALGAVGPDTRDSGSGDGRRRRTYPFKHCRIANPPRRGCICPRCVEWRHYAKIHARDNKRLARPGYEKAKASKRRLYQRNRLAYLIYAQLQKLMRADARVARHVPCECGCGVMIPHLTSRGRPMRYAQGHYTTVRHRMALAGRLATQAQDRTRDPGLGPAPVTSSGAG